VGIALGQRVAGYFAWLAWLAIHIAFLVGFRNRIAVLFNWAYVYITKRRHAELIIGQVPLPQATSVERSQAQPVPRTASEPVLKQAQELPPGQPALLRSSQ
jgi:NADH dehydrogenase